MKLNHRDYKEYREGLSIQDVIEESRFTWHKLVVRLNGRVIRPEEYDITILEADDDLEVIHLLAGG